MGMDGGRKKAGQIDGQVFVIQSNHAEEFVLVPESKFLFLAFQGEQISS